LRALTSIQTPLVHALTICGIVLNNNLKATTIVFYDKLIGMWSLKIHKGMENRVLLRQHNQSVVIVHVWQEMSYIHNCIELGFVIRRYSFYPFVFGYSTILSHEKKEEIEGEG
jgi:hypothetical protein